MVSITLSVPPELRSKMNAHDEVNWSGYIRKCIIKKTSELEWKERMLKQFAKEPTDLAAQLQRKSRAGRADELKEKRTLMKLVVDTNVLITYFWPESVSRTLFSDARLVLFSPEYALEEINKHRGEICKKTGLSEREYRVLLEDMALSVAFVPLEEYAGRLNEAAGKTPDANDADFVALSLALDCPLWTNDKRLKESKIGVLDTPHVIDLIS